MNETEPGSAQDPTTRAVAEGPKGHEGGSEPAERVAKPVQAERAGQARKSDVAGQAAKSEAKGGGDADGGSAASDDGASGSGSSGEGTSSAARRRRRGSRGGRNRNRNRSAGSEAGTAEGQEGPDATGGRSGTGSEAANGEPPSPKAPTTAASPAGGAGAPAKAPGQAPGAPRKPQIGDSRPAPAPAPPAANGDQGSKDGASGAGSGTKRRRRRGGRGRGSGQGASQGGQANAQSSTDGSQNGGNGKGKGRNQPKGQGKGRSAGAEPVTAITDAEPVVLDEKTLERRRGRERKGKPVGRYLMAVQVQEKATQISVLEGRSLIEHYVSRPADEVTQIHGNIYLGRVQNVLPGMEAAFVDIGTPKNAVLYRSDTRLDPGDVDQKHSELRIEEMLKAKQTILCQVTKNPIGAKGARLTQEVSLPGRFVVLVPNSTTYGISKRLPDQERKRLRSVLDKVKPDGHGLIVRTAAEGISADELRADVARLAEQWKQIEALAARSKAPALLYRDPDLSIRVIREEFNQDYRQVVIDDPAVYEQVRDYVRSISPALVERVELYDPAEHGGLPMFETHRIHEQLHKALDRKVWLPSGGSLIIERTEALTVIDVNTGKNVGTSNLEQTVFANNLEAAEEVARQLRLRDIGGIIVIDFIDMEIKENRDKVVSTFRKALARDKTRTQVFDISELGLVEMTRKRIGEGLLESLSTACPTCEGLGMVFDTDLVGS